MRVQNVLADLFGTFGPPAGRSGSVGFELVNTRLDYKSYKAVVKLCAESGEITDSAHGHMDRVPVMEAVG
jgi:hypothetical protein